MRLLVFLHGTTLMHPGAAGRSRAERVSQVRDGIDPTVNDFAAYVPVGDAVAKLRRWQEQGAEISYLSPHRDPGGIADDGRVLRRHGFPPGEILTRAAGESYGDVAGRALPDVLVEDDCESIGGAKEVTYPQIPARLRARIRSIVVPEFGGIDHLPDSLDELQGIATRRFSRRAPSRSRAARRTACSRGGG
jgi:hypothetical protein